MVVSDYIAQWLEKKGICHAFGIIGAGNAALFDAIHRRGFTEIICVHHEQAATMACQAYFRTCGTMGVSLVTTGGGSANAVTGVLSAHLDSIPTFTIAGNEAIGHCESLWRGWGVQGFDSVAMVDTFTKDARRMRTARQVTYYLDEMYEIAFKDRPGPVWLEIPRDIQLWEVPHDAIPVS